MNTYWSTYVQEPEELYYSRQNKLESGLMTWLNELLPLGDGARVLDIGCGPGAFCHAIKRAHPLVEVTGLDRDSDNVAYARQKAEEIGISCKFIEGDASCLPLGGGSFDVCISHTVLGLVEPVSFLAEQYRVLRPGGMALTLSSGSGGGKAESWIPDESCEEKSFFDRIWIEAEKNANSRITRYDGSPQNCMRLMHAQGFTGIDLKACAVVVHFPDGAGITEERAIVQINLDRQCEKCSVRKARRMAPGALSDYEYGLMLDMIDRRYDKRIARYLRGERSWEHEVATVLAIMGRKE